MLGLKEKDATAGEKENKKKKHIVFDDEKIVSV